MASHSQKERNGTTDGYLDFLSAVGKLHEEARKVPKKEKKEKRAVFVHP